MDGEAFEEELNVFLRFKKILGCPVPVSAGQKGGSKAARSGSIGNARVREGSAVPLLSLFRGLQAALNLIIMRTKALGLEHKLMLRFVEI